MTVFKSSLRAFKSKAGKKMRSIIIIFLLFSTYSLFSSTSAFENAVPEDPTIHVKPFSQLSGNEILDLAVKLVDGDVLAEHYPEAEILTQESTDKVNDDEYYFRYTCFYTNEKRIFKVIPTRILVKKFIQEIKKANINPVSDFVSYYIYLRKQAILSYYQKQKFADELLKLKEEFIANSLQSSQLIG